MSKETKFVIIMNIDGGEITFNFTSFNEAIADYNKGIMDIKDGRVPYENINVRLMKVDELVLAEDNFINEDC